MFAFACSNCQKTLKAPEEKRGSQTRCPFCKQAVVIPHAASTDIVAAPAAAPVAARIVTPPAPPAVAPVAVTVETLAKETPAGPPSSFFTDFQKDLGVTLAGAATSFVTVFLVWLIEANMNFSLYTISYCFVIPVGAILVGGVAASGYYVGAFFLGRRPSRWLLVNIVIISVLAFFEIHSLSYNSFVQSHPSFRGVGFFDYLAIVYQESEHQVRGSSIGKLGAWGYLEMLLEIGGFALGGVVVWALLVAQPYCEKCQRYLSRKGSQRRFSAHPLEHSSTAREMAKMALLGQVQQAIDLHAVSGTTGAERSSVMQSDVTVKRCTTCNVHWIGFSVKRKSGNEWQEDQSLAFSFFHHIEFDARG